MLTTKITSSPANIRPPRWDRILMWIGGQVIKTIKARVDKGQMPDGRAFTEYSEGYAAYKQAIGRSPGSKGDYLRLTGQMLGSLVVLEYNSQVVKVGFSGDHVRGGPKRPGYKPRHSTSKAGRTGATALNVEIAYVNNERRPFFTISDVEYQKILALAVIQAKKQGWV